ncbi:MAG: indolepyruvate ferredoxin oxidoreductase family protein [Actinomycetales bacterium]|nr:indolepyruvate ferredoxin oxidoreductase family protein [Actinomycetales bacterium]
MTPPASQMTLSDRYLVQDGTIFLNGLQALVRLPLDVARFDRRAGRRTAGYVSGYEGSPLAGYDLELARCRPLMDEHDVLLRPCVNEELAATGVMGTQHACASERRTTDGVVGYWYGKAPGLDRATDALRHGNLGGAHPDGGVLVIVGDDGLAKSSTVPSSSEMALAELGMPVLSPADAQDVLDLGLHGVLLSRFSGLWASIKIATNVADGGRTVRVHPDRIVPVIPDNHVDGVPYVHRVSAHFLQPHLAPLERSLLHDRVELARRYAVANGLNRRHGSTSARLGIITAGTSYLPTREALTVLGVDEQAMERTGIAILALGMISPLDPQQIRGFAEGLDEVIVVEEKRPFVEVQVKDILYGLPGAPRISGKRTPEGAPLLRAEADLTATLIAQALRQRLAAYADLPADPAAAQAPSRSLRGMSLPLLQRIPYFCSGCPHNRSTRNPDTVLVGAGIGCHTMVVNLPASRTGSLIGFSQMGGEGAMWAGMEPFVADEHLVQNLGDGTFHHSGSLAIRAAVAAGSNITFRLLYNSVVAMTGGQRAVGVMSVPNLVQSLRAEGVRRIVITTDDPRRYRDADLPLDVDVVHRDRLDAIQAELVATPGVTVLINDQECATELRRRRKRGLAREAGRHAYINERVCEGCGDCGDKSNCLSVQPVMTEYGRKTRIHQASCNADETCLSGDCPSFITVVPAHKRGRRTRARTTVIVPDLEASAIPSPPRPATSDVSMRITGIGGTGVVTVSQVLATAASIGGLFVQSLDQTGLAQKGGAVVSDLRFSAEPVDRANCLGPGQADVYLACDLLVAATDANLEAASPDRTHAIISTTQVPTGAMVADPSVHFPEIDQVLGRLSARMRSERHVDARALALDLFADDHFANVLLVGMAVQSGLLPLDPANVEQALTLNGVAVERNHQAFRRGRQLVADPDALSAAIAAARPAPAQPAIDPRAARLADLALAGSPADASALHDLVLRRASDLIAYQGALYAKEYAQFIGRVRAAEAAVDPGSDRLTMAVAQYLHKLMAYKDEYEVARLSVDPALRASIEAEFGSGASYGFMLQPPILRAMGLRRKIRLSRRLTPALHLLARLRFTRGTPLDIFGLARVRRTERALIGEYRAALESALQDLRVDDLDQVVALAELPDMVRGYEDIKLRNVERYRAAVSAALTELTAADRRTPIPA